MHGLVHLVPVTDEEPEEMMMSSQKYLSLNDSISAGMIP